MSRFTIRQALEKLVSIGVVRIVQGSGIWINEHARNNPLIYNSITEKRFDQMRYRMLSLHKRRPDRAAQQIFGIAEESFIWHFCRLRYVDDQPVQLEVSSMPVADFPDLNQQAIERSIQQYVVSKGLTISHMLTTYRAVSVSREQAVMLGCKKAARQCISITVGYWREGASLKSAISLISTIPVPTSPRGTAIT